MATSQAEVDAPRQETDLYGEPVAEYGDGGEYWEAYTDEDYPRSIYVAHYIRRNGEWVKDGLDRHNVDSLFNFDGWPTD